jgi:hypothetical protein
LARRNGSAIAIGHPHPTTVRVLQQMVYNLPPDITLVRPSSLLNEPQVDTSTPNTAAAGSAAAQSVPRREAVQSKHPPEPVNASRFFTILSESISQSTLVQYYQLKWQGWDNPPTKSSGSRMYPPQNRRPEGALIGAELGELIPAENHFAGLAGAHRIKALLEIINAKTVGDDRRQIESRLDQRGHLVPGFKHFPAINPFDKQPLENNLGPVDRHIRRRNTQHGNTPAVVHGIEHGAERRRRAGHLQPTSNPSVMPSSAITSFRFSFATFTARVTPILRASSSDIR